MTQNTSNTATAKPGRWLRGLLFVSLALNLLVVGAVVGRTLGDDRADRRGPRGGVDQIMPFTRALAPDDRRALGQSFRRSMNTGRDVGGAIMSGYQEALVLLRAEPFDAAALAAVFDQQSRFAETRRKSGQEALVALLADLDAPARQEYADRLEAEMTRLQERGHSWSKGKKDRH